jgi:hypothetical protein
MRLKRRKTRKQHILLLILLLIYIIHLSQRRDAFEEAEDAETAHEPQHVSARDIGEEHREHRYRHHHQVEPAYAFSSKMSSKMIQRRGYRRGT